jgi:hypothetical protein
MDKAPRRAVLWMEDGGMTGNIAVRQTAAFKDDNPRSFLGEHLWI